MEVELSDTRHLTGEEPTLVVDVAPHPASVNVTANSAQTGR